MYVFLLSLGARFSPRLPLRALPVATVRELVVPRLPRVCKEVGECRRWASSRGLIGLGALPMLLILEVLLRAGIRVGSTSCPGCEDREARGWVSASRSESYSSPTDSAAVLTLRPRALVNELTVISGSCGKLDVWWCTRPWGGASAVPVLTLFGRVLPFGASSLP